MKMSVGVDLHKSQMTVCMLRENHKEIEEAVYPTTAGGYADLLGDLVSWAERGDTVAVAVESTGNARYFKNQMERAGFPVTVVNTMKFKVVNESVKKTDHHDAKTLAEFLEKEMLPESRLCSQESEDIRRVLKTRTAIVRTVVTVKNQIHGMLLGYGIETKRAALQSKRERQRILNGLEDHDDYGHAAKAVKPLLETIDNLSAEVKRLTELLEQMVYEDEDVKLLRTIPGVGLITASTIRAYTDDIGRYKDSKAYASYTGLVPWVQNSNETIHHGHITKRGSSELRTAFVQMSLGMIRMPMKTGGFRIMMRYQDMKKYKGSGRSIVATSRKLATIVHSMLTKRREFDPAMMLSRQ
ncbi:MAG: IS110 family transposase [Spirochaetia bacterium]|nr:IS110 family transposase [Spirochaetia bacterium]